MSFKTGLLPGISHYRGPDSVTYLHAWLQPEGATHEHGIGHGLGASAISGPS